MELMNAVFNFTDWLIGLGNDLAEIFGLAECTDLTRSNPVGKKLVNRFEHAGF